MAKGIFDELIQSATKDRPKVARASTIVLGFCIGAICAAVMLHYKSHDNITHFWPLLPIVILELINGIISGRTAIFLLNT